MIENEGLRFMYDLYSIAVYNYIKDHIRDGHVFTHIYDDDVLRIRIEKNGINMLMKWPNISRKIVYGYGAVEIAKEALRVYKQNVLNEFFR